MLTIKEIAEELKVTAHYIRQEIKKGKLKAVLFGNRAGYRIEEEDYLRWIKRKKEGK